MKQKEVFVINHFFIIMYNIEREKKTFIYSKRQGAERVEGNSIKKFEIFWVERERERNGGS